MMGTTVAADPGTGIFSATPGADALLMTDGRLFLYDSDILGGGGGNGVTTCEDGAPGGVAITMQGTDPVVVVLTPGVQTRAFMLGFVEPSRLVTGLIALISYQAPLSGETRFPKPGVAYWFPPLGKSPFEGARAQDCVDALLRGGQPAVAREGLSSSAGMDPSSLV